ncbi:Fanconi anemia group B protein [Arapaima gigas]
MVSQEDRSPWLVAFNGDIFSFELTGSTPRESQSRGSSQLAYRRMSFERHSGQFSIKNEGMAFINKSSSLDVHFVSCAPALDVKSGQTVPCILLRKCRRKSTGFKYVFLILCSSGSLDLHLEFRLPYEIKDSVTFLQGPTVLWSHEGTVFYTSSEAREVRQVPIELSSIIFIGELPVDSRKIIVLGSQKSTKDANCQLDIIWPHRSLGYLLEDGRLLDAEWALPHAYSSVVKCVFFVSAKEVSSGLKSTVVAATSKKQLVWFECGVPKHMCQLPFEDPKSIEMADTGRDGCLFIVSFTQRRFCSVWKNSFQVARCWEDVTWVFVDDFVGCGTDQMLLLYEDPMPQESKLANFTITDLSDITYTSRPEEREALGAAEPVQDNHLLTIQALESRLQGGVTLIQDLQRELRVKDRVLFQSLQALVNAVAGREHHVSRTYQEGMVSLWDDEEEVEGREDGSAEQMLLTPLTLPAPVKKIWQRVIEDQLVVGVVLTPEAACLVSAETVSGSLLIEGDQGPVTCDLQSYSRTFQGCHPPLLAPIPSHHREPMAKRRRQEHAGGAGGGAVQKLTVTIVTAVEPVVASVSRRCTVLLHSVLNQRNVSNWAPRGPRSTQCGHVSLDIQELSQGKYLPQLLNNGMLTTEESLEDLLSLLAVFKSWSFRLWSAEHTLCDVSQWLLGPMQCRRVAVSPDFLLSVPPGPAGSLLIRWQEKSQFLGELHVHCRSQTDLFQFLDLLCRFLPSSCEVQPCHGRGTEDLLGVAGVTASALEAEVATLREGVLALLNNAHSEVLPCAPEPNATESPDELQRCRAETERDRERSKRLRSPLVGVEQYRRLTSAVAQVQLDGDVAAHSLLDILSAFSFSSGDGFV